jgi:hypothetical protein
MVAGLVIDAEVFADGQSERCRPRPLQRWHTAWRSNKNQIAKSEAMNASSGVIAIGMRARVPDDRCLRIAAAVYLGVDAGSERRQRSRSVDRRPGSSVRQHSRAFEAAGVGTAHPGEKR